MSFNILPQKTVFALSPLLLLLGKHEKVFGYLYPYIMEKCYMYVIIGCSITLLLYFTIMLFSSSSPMVEASLVSTERPLDLGAAKQNTLLVYPLRPPVKRPPVKCSSVKRLPVKCSSMKFYFFYNHKVCLIFIIHLHRSSISSLTDSCCWVHEFLISRLISWSP